MFALDSRLNNDTLFLGDLPLSRVLLANDSQYPWLILVPRREEVSEVFQLDVADQAQLWKETTQVAGVLNTVFAADKINVAALGNVVKQLHMHVVARFETDVAWPGPIWGKHPAKPYSSDELALIKAKLEAALADLDWTAAQ